MLPPHRGEEVRRPEHPAPARDELRVLGKVRWDGVVVVVDEPDDAREKQPRFVGTMAHSLKVAVDGELHKGGSFLRCGGGDLAVPQVAPREPAFGERVRGAERPTQRLVSDLCAFEGPMVLSLEAQQLCLLQRLEVIEVGLVDEGKSRRLVRHLEARQHLLAHHGERLLDIDVFVGGDLEQRRDADLGQTLPSRSLGKLDDRPGCLMLSEAHQRVLNLSL
mmetsp:Transcript_21081/g.50016  ORF Transcript_21081/g.50016 Transcript_21081/m.50016 type:complete len:220 (-) Transcript_21081:481-1140(-)